jgi:tetratricopeptide (TPR) repeat protein
MTRQGIRVGILLAVGAVIIPPLQRAIDADAGSARPTEEALYLSADTLKRVSVGFEGVVADLYWVRTVHYYGQRAFRPGQRFDLLEPLLDIITRLDPQFQAAYRLGALFLALPPPGGAGRPERALALLDRGIAANPDDWQLILDKGFIYLWELGDYARAAETFDRARQHRRAPAWTKGLAAAAYAKAGRREIARRLWLERYHQAENDLVKKNAAFQLACLDAQQEIEDLTAAVTRFRHDHGRQPRSWDELIQSGLLTRRPLDPYGFPYVLDEKTADVRLSPDSPLVLPRL